jgi:transposase-like protein
MGGVRMAKMKGPKKTKRYPDEFKIKAVELAEHPDILAKLVSLTVIESRTENGDIRSEIA